MELRFQLQAALMRSSYRITVIIYSTSHFLTRRSFLQIHYRAPPLDFKFETQKAFGEDSFEEFLRGFQLYPNTDPD